MSRSAHSGHETCSAVLNRWVFYSCSCCQYFHKVHLQFRWRVVGIHLQYFSFDKTPSQISEGREAVWRREGQSLARQIWKWGLRANLWLGVFLFYQIRVCWLIFSSACSKLRSKNQDIRKYEEKSWKYIFLCCLCWSHFTFRSTLGRSGDGNNDISCSSLLKMPHLLRFLIQTKSITFQEEHCLFSGCEVTFLWLSWIGGWLWRSAKSCWTRILLSVRLEICQTNITRPQFLRNENYPKNYDLHIASCAISKKCWHWLDVCSIFGL